MPEPPDATAGPHRRCRRRLVAERRQTRRGVRVAHRLLAPLLIGRIDLGLPEIRGAVRCRQRPQHGPERRRTIAAGKAGRRGIARGAARHIAAIPPGRAGGCCCCHRRTARLLGGAVLLQRLGGGTPRNRDVAGRPGGVSAANCRRAAVSATGRGPARGAPPRTGRGRYSGSAVSAAVGERACGRTGQPGTKCDRQCRAEECCAGQHQSLSWISLGRYSDKSCGCRSRACPGSPERCRLS